MKLTRYIALPIITTIIGCSGSKQERPNIEQIVNKQSINIPATRNIRKVNKQEVYYTLGQQGWKFIGNDCEFIKEVNVDGLETKTIDFYGGYKLKGYIMDTPEEEKNEFLVLPLAYSEKFVDRRGKVLPGCYSVWVK